MVKAAWAISSTCLHRRRRSRPNRRAKAGRGLGVNVEDDFDPLYIIPDKKKKVVAELKEAVKKASSFNSPPTKTAKARASAAPAQTLKPKQAGAAHGLHEITREATAEALNNTTSTWTWCAQETRRILDRLWAGRFAAALAQDRAEAVGRACRCGRTPAQGERERRLSPASTGT